MTWVERKDATGKPDVHGKGGRTGRGKRSDMGHKGGTKSVNRVSMGTNRGRDHDSKERTGPEGGGATWDGRVDGMAGPEGVQNGSEDGARDRVVRAVMQESITLIRKSCQAELPKLRLVRSAAKSTAVRGRMMRDTP